MKSSFFLLALFILATPVQAAPQLYSLPNLVATAQDHWPGPDGLIATTDDLTDANASPINSSGWNNVGSFSYNAFDFVGDGSVSETLRLPPGMNAVSFLSGSITIDTAVALNGGGALVVQWDFSGTEPFVGHGAYSSLILQVNSGSYDPVTHALTMNVDFQATLLGGTATTTNFDMSGEAFWLDRSRFAAGTGNSYVDNVLIPFADAAGDNSLVYVRATGVVPASTGGTGGSFPQMPVEAVIVGTSSFQVAIESTSWSKIKELYDE